MARDTLDTLVRVNRFEVDEKRRALQALLDQEAEIAEAIARLDAEVQREQEAAAAPDIGALGAVYGDYAAAAKVRRDGHLAELEALGPDIEAARDALADAFGVLKKYEIARAHRSRAEADAEAHREGLELDELGLAAHRRGGGRADGPR